MTIRYKISLSIGIPLLITYLGMLAWDYHRQRATAMEQMQQSVLERAEHIAAQLDARLFSVMQSAESTALLLGERPGLGEAPLRLLLAEQIRRSPWATGMTVVLEPANGSDVGLSAKVERRGPFRRGESDAAAATSAWYLAIKENRLATWQAESPDRSAAATKPVGELAFLYVVPIVNGDRFRGALAVTIPVREFRQLRGRPFIPGGSGRDAPPPGATGPFAERGRFGLNRPRFQFAENGEPFAGGPSTRPVGPPPTEFNEPPTSRDAGMPLMPPTTNPIESRAEEFAVFDQQGRIITAPDDGLHPDAVRPTLFEVAERLGRAQLADAAHQALAGKSQVIEVAGLQQIIPSVPNDNLHWVAFAPVPASKWAIVTAIPQSTVMDPLLSQIWQRAAFLFAGSGVLMLVVLAVSIRMSRPVERLAGAVDRLAAGDLDAEVTGVRGRDELGRLASAFNHMTGQLRSHVAALTEQAAAREKAESELRFARQIQTDMLPKTFPPFPDRPEFDLHAINRPALGVAGDFYDFFFTPEGLLTVVIADVSGKGIPAALLMAVTRTVVRNLGQAGLGPTQICERANATLLADTSAAMFVTMLLCQYDPATGRLTYVNAGHPNGYRISAGHPPRRCCDLSSPLLGVAGTNELGPFEQGEEILAPGESILLFTDGVTEARSPAGDMLRDSGLQAYLARHGSLDPADLCVDLVSYVDEFEGGHRHDDLTLLVLRRSAVPS